MSDLTVVYLTLNRGNPGWRKYHLDTLREAAKGHQIISISREPIDMGLNLEDTGPYGYINIYRQMLRAAKIIKTPYMAVAEDDTLYSKEHFNCFRPQPDEAAYNRSRWSVFQWDGGYCYSLRNRVSNCSFIGHRELVIDAIEERFKKLGDEWPLRWTGEIGRINVERGLKVTRRKLVEFYSEVPILQVSHSEGTETRQRTARKRHAQVKAFDIPFWGKSTDIIEKFNE